MDDRKVLDPKAVVSMIALTAVWGLQQIALKLAAPDMAPTLQIALRSGIAVVIVIGILLSRGARSAMLPALAPGLLAGIFFALEFFLVGEGLKHTNASHMSIFLYTAPVFTALGLHIVLPSERLRPLQWLGIAVAFAGIVVAFMGHERVSEAPHWLGDLMGIGAGLAFAATTLTIRLSRLSTAPSVVTLFYQLIVAFVSLTGVAVVTHQLAIVPSFRLLASLTFQALIVCTISFIVWFSLLQTYLASHLSILTFLTPVFGVGFAVLLLKEPVSQGFLLGALMVFMGILLVSKSARSCALVKKQHDASPLELDHKRRKVR